MCFKTLEPIPLLETKFGHQLGAVVTPKRPENTFTPFEAPVPGLIGEGKADEHALVRFILAAGFADTISSLSVAELLPTPVGVRNPWDNSGTLLCAAHAVTLSLVTLRAFLTVRLTR